MAPADRHDDDIHADDLQFDHAEPLSAPVGADEAQDAAEQPAPAATDCAACHQPLTDLYYELNNQMICPDCRGRIVRQQEGGSGTGRLLRAGAFGSIAAAVCALIWGGITWLTGYVLGIIAIVVGIAVGAAVRTGSRGRGGLVYQLLAVFLTHVSITAIYVPDVFAAFMQAANEQSQAASAPASSAPASQPAPASAPAQAAGPGAPGALEGLFIAAAMAILLLVCFGFAAAAPFLGGIMMILITGFAWWEAWKMNRRVELKISGPHRLDRDRLDGDPLEAIHA